MTSVKALYIHIPFCDHICTYCDFYKMIAKENLKEKYVNYLINELNIRKNYLSKIETIYIGGGTPSNLNISLLEKIFSKLKELIDFSKVLEFTIEANPIDINNEFCELLKENKITRVSLGIQSLNNNKLSILGRNHQKKDVIRAINILRNNHINNINADLIYGIGKESFYSIKKDLKTLIKLKIKHFSPYSLILEEKTILFNKFQKNEFFLMNEDKERKIYYKIAKFLQKKGYIHYEISNFSLPGYKSLHNLTYWNNEKYLGIGSNASYYLDDYRYTNINNLDLYFQGIDDNQLIYKEKIYISEIDKIKEELILGLRKIKGINLNEFYNKYNKNLIEIFPVINDLVKHNILVIKDGNMFVSYEKLYMLNEILVKII